MKRRVEYDGRVVELQQEEVAEILREMEGTLISYAMTPVDLTILKALVRTSIFNTEGSELVQEGTYVGALATVSSRAENQKPIQYTRYQLLRSLSGFNPTSLVKEISEELRKLSKDQVKLESGEYMAVLSPAVVKELLSYAFVNSLCADQVISGVSPLAEKLGEEIASKEITIWDDSTLEGGLYTFAFDDEGVPSSRTFLIEEGVLKGFMYDSITARLRGFRSTSNCARWESPYWDEFYARSYKCRPRVWMSNLVIKPGSGDVEDLISEMESGIYCLEVFSGFTMSPSGDFSLPVLHGYKVEGGEIVGPLKGVSIKGNAFELLKQVIRVGEELSIEVPSNSSGSVVSPPVLLRKIEAVRT